MCIEDNPHRHRLILEKVWEMNIKTQETLFSKDIYKKAS